MKKNFLEFFFVIFFLCFLLFFRSHNIGIDGYYFLAKYLYSDNQFEPHHLLHHAIYHALINFFQFFVKNFSVDFVFQLLNSLFFVASLVIVQKIRKLIFKEEDYFWILVLAFSGAGLRYATEVEVYIFPLFLNLLGIYFFYLFIEKQSNLNFILGSFFVCFAVLNHQVQWIGWLVISYYIFFYWKVSWNYFGYHLMISLIVPIIYWWVSYSQGLGFWEYAFMDYQNGSAELSFGWKNIALTIINLPRTLIYFNESFFVINQNPVFILITIILLCIFVFSIFIFIRYLMLIKYNFNQKLFLHLMVAYAIFAMISHGNYEFMVGIPFFLVIILPNFKINSLRFKIIFILSILTWNLIFLLIPFRFGDFYGKETLKKIYDEKSEVYFLIKESYWFRNFIYYHTGIEKPHRIIMQLEPEKMNRLLEKGIVIYTDYGNLENPNRRNFMKNYDFPKNYKLIKKEKFLTYFGEKYLYQIEHK